MEPEQTARGNGGSSVPSYRSDDLNRIRKACPGRERIEDIRRIGISIDGPDGALLLEVAEYLLDVRQVLRGGRREIDGGRSWPSA